MLCTIHHHHYHHHHRRRRRRRRRPRVLLTEGKMSKAWEPFELRRSFGNLKALAGKKFLDFKVKVKCTLVQALRLCTGRRAHRGSRGIALLFYDHGTRRE